MMKAMVRHGDEERLTDPAAEIRCIQRAVEVEAVRQRKLECTSCGSKYHLKANCPLGKTADSIHGQIAPPISQMSVARANTINIEFLAHTHAPIPDGYWCVSQGSSVHIVGDPCFSVQLEDAYLGKEERVHDFPLDPSLVAGRGRVTLVRDIHGNELHASLDDVYYLPGAPYSVFSLRAARREFELHCDHRGQYYIKRNGKVKIRTVAGEHGQTKEGDMSGG